MTEQQDSSTPTPPPSTPNQFDLGTVIEQGNIDPEATGRAVGEFLRGMQEAAEKAAQKAEQEATENN